MFDREKEVVIAYSIPSGAEFVRGLEASASRDSFTIGKNAFNPVEILTA